MAFVHLQLIGNLLFGFVGLSLHIDKEHLLNVKPSVHCCAGFLILVLCQCARCVIFFFWLSPVVFVEWNVLV